MSQAALLLLFLFLVKHLVVDFFLQGPYQYKNKGIYGHGGGILHATLHYIGTFVVVLPFNPTWCAVIAFLDLIIHYHIDWAKVNVNAYFGWGPTTSEKFWYLLGVDQFLHMLTYLGFVAILVGVK